MKGRNILKGKTVNCTINDIAPTLLYLHDLPLLENMDGGVLNEVFDKKQISEFKIKKIPNIQKKYSDGKGVSAAEQEKIAEKLKDLGYL